MRRTRMTVIWAVIGAIVIVTLLTFYFWMPRCPVELRVVKVEPNSLIYFGEKKAMQVTLSVRRSDGVLADEIQSFQAKVGGRWLEFQAAGFPGAGFPAPVGGGIRAGAGTERERAETLFVPEGCGVCRVQVRCDAHTWKWQFKERLSPRARSWVAKSPWLANLVLPDLAESIFLAPSRTNVVEIVIPRTDSK